MNYFAHSSVATRYASGRPYYQPLVMQKIAARLRLARPLARALDVGCGTGNSSRALLDVADQAVGVDASRGMLAEAPRLDRLHYVESTAEQLPFAEAAFDLLTASSAFHWFDRARFFPEAHRVLRSAGWLVVYRGGPGGQMRENPDLERWLRQVYRPRYPAPPRHGEPLDEAGLAPFGFALVARDTFTHEVTFTVEEFAHHLTTHSNVIAAVESGTESLDDVRSWLIASLRPLFPVPRGTFPFAGTITYLQKR